MGASIDREANERPLGPSEASGHRLIHRLVPPFALLLAGFAFLYPLWTTRGILYSKHSDIIAQHLSVKALAGRSLATEGRLPLWDPSVNCGSPVWANTESMYLYPLNILFLVLPLDIATNAVLVLNVLVAGLSMYVFSRRLLTHRSAALFSGIAYMLSYRHLAIVYVGWLSHTTMYALTPLLFWACDRALEKTDRSRVSVFSLVVALSLVQGSMQLLYYAGIGCILFVAYRLFGLGGRDRLRALAGLAAGAVLGALLAAPALLPRLEFAALSTRMADKADYHFFLYDSPGVAELITLLDPLDREGQRDEFWEKSFYFGFWLVPLCLTGALAKRRGQKSLLAVSAAMVLLCFDTPLLRFLYDYFPGFQLFRQTPRILLLAQFTLSLLGAGAVDELVSGRPRGLGVSAAAAVWLGLAALGAVAAAAAALEAPPIFVSACILAIAGLAIRRSERLTGSVAILLCLLPFLDTGMRLWPRLATLPMDQAFPADPLHDTLRRGPVTGRTLALGRDALPYGMAGYFGIDMANGFASLNLRHYREYVDVLEHGHAANPPRMPSPWTDFEQVSRPDMLRALDVQFVVANEPGLFEGIGCEKVDLHERVPVFVFYEGIRPVPVFVCHVSGPLGPAYFASSVEGVADEKESLRAIEEDPTVLRAHVLGLDGGDHPEFGPGAGGEVRMVERGLAVYEYEVRSDGPSFLIVSQIWYPGWRASLDGQPVPVYRTNHALIGCPIPAGSHRLRIVMESPPLRRGAVLAAAAFVLLAGINLAGKRRPSTRPCAATGGGRSMHGMTGEVD